VKIARALAALAACLAASAFAADRLELPGATSAFYILKPYAESIREASSVDLVVSPVGSSQAVLDVLDGRAQAAIVTSPLVDAVAAARVLAWGEQHRLVAVPAGLTYIQLPALDATGRMLGIVTVAPSPQLQRVVQYLTSRPPMVTAAVAR
jgi:hypothetical protein